MGKSTAILTLKSIAKIFLKKFQINRKE